jgi:hypothetical protein
MTRIADVEHPAITVKAAYRIGARLFGMVPTPEKLLARRLPLMLGVGGFYGALEWCGKIDRPLRALLNLQVARLYGSAY